MKKENFEPVSPEVRIENLLNQYREIEETFLKYEAAVTQYERISEQMFALASHAEDIVKQVAERDLIPDIDELERLINDETISVNVRDRLKKLFEGNVSGIKSLKRKQEKIFAPDMNLQKAQEHVAAAREAMNNVRRLLIEQGVHEDEIPFHEETQ